MLIKDKDGNTRVAYANDFNDVTITLTPSEWQELTNFFEYRHTYHPSVFHKSSRSIYTKLLENKPTLKNGLVAVDTEIDKA